MLALAGDVGVGAIGTSDKRGGAAVRMHFVGQARVMQEVNGTGDYGGAARTTKTSALTVSISRNVPISDCFCSTQQKSLIFSPFL